MDSSSGEWPQRQLQPGAMPAFPKIWLGYLLGLATSVAEIVAVKLHPELLGGQLLVPPLYLFLANFVSVVYWMVCVYELHMVLAFVSGGQYPIKPLRAAWFHLIPIYGLYWVYKWPRELALFVNARANQPLMNPQRIGVLLSLAFVFFLILDRGLGMILLFWGMSYLSAGLRRALAEPPVAQA
jgi:hypothetical protein